MSNCASKNTTNKVIIYVWFCFFWFAKFTIFLKILEFMEILQCKLQLNKRPSDYLWIKITQLLQKFRISKISVFGSFGDFAVLALTPDMLTQIKLLSAQRQHLCHLMLESHPTYLCLDVMDLFCF